MFVYLVPYPISEGRVRVLCEHMQSGGIECFLQIRLPSFMTFFLLYIYTQRKQE